MVASRWQITETALNLSTARAYEGLFTQGSGYLQVRGSLEEHLAGAPQQVSYTRMPTNITAEKFPETAAKWGTYVPGVFGTHPFLNNEMINLPWFLGLAPIVEGERLDLTTATVTGYQRTLDLRTAVLSRTFAWHTRAGAVVCVTFERFISAARTHLCLQRMTLTTDRDVAINVMGGIDADVRTNGFDHFSEVVVNAIDARTIACQIITDQDDTVAMQTILSADGIFGVPQLETPTVRAAVSLALRAGEVVTVEKRTAVTTSRDLNPTTPASILAEAAACGYEQLLAEHTAVWAQRWAACDVEVDGDDDSQLAMRVSLYHLLRSHVPNDPRVAVDAKGYAGEAYMGRYFWDTEMYLVPFFLYTDPTKARTLVDFRVQTLPGAQRNAANYGYPGARYPWEADADGNECTPLWQYRDHEVHVTADVAYALAHFAAAVDPAYLQEAAPAIVEMARYWQARIDWRAGEDVPSLLGVMGPDEYTPLSSNNAYTNRLVAFTMKLAEQIGAAGGATLDECAAFRRIAETLPILRTPEGLVLQCEEFLRYAEPNFDQHWIDRQKTYASQVGQERIYRSKCLKQADVLMLMLLFPQEFTDEEVRRAWDAYVPYTTHDSSLSAGAHAIIATRLGLMDAAWAFWQQSSRLDLDTAHGGAAEGIHIAACGVNWQIAVQGFAGLRTALQAEALMLEPRLPQPWTRLAFPLIWHGCPVYVEITDDACTVTNRGAESLTVSVSAKLQVIAPGRHHTFATVSLNGSTRTHA